MRKVILLICLLCSFSSVFADSCHPVVDESRKQYLIGYGILMNSLFKKSLPATFGVSLPIILRGYERYWTLISHDESAKSLYIAAFPKKNAKMNAVVFSLMYSAEMKLIDLDNANAGYCRIQVPVSKINFLLEQLPRGFANAQYWMYVPQKVSRPISRRNSTISESEVDVFLAGCIGMEAAYGINAFADQCVATTLGWRANWIKDRKYHKRYYIQLIDERHVDRLIRTMLPKLYKRIKARKEKEAANR